MDTLLDTPQQNLQRVSPVVLPKPMEWSFYDFDNPIYGVPIPS